MAMSIEERRDLAAGLGVFMSTAVKTIDELTKTIADLRAKDAETAEILSPLTEILKSSKITQNSITPEGDLLNPNPATDSALEMLDELPTSNTGNLDTALETTVGTSDETTNGDEIIQDEVTLVVDELAEADPLDETLFTESETEA